MLKSLAQGFGKAAGFVLYLAFTALTGWLAWVAYQQYLDEHLYRQISTEGKRVSVKTDAVDRAYRSWKDQFVNVVYIAFTYQQKPYTLRYRQDTGWLNTGDRVDLFYHAGLDVFRQPKTHAFFRENGTRSHLIGYTIVSMWNDERKWLVGTIGLTAIFFMLLSGVLATLTGIQGIRAIGRLLFTCMLLTGVGYLTYNTWRYYRYHSQVKSGGREETVQVLGTNSRAASHRNTWFYTYEATVQHGRQERLIPIEESEYKTLKAGDPLQVYFNPVLNDMMSVNHTPDHANLLAVLFAWCLVIFVGWRQWRQWRNRPSGNSRPPF